MTPSAVAHRRGVRNRRRPAVEIMEARELLSTFTVTTTADSGPGSLRQAIADANTTTGPNVIDFAIDRGPKTIVPASPLPAISNPVTIDATTQPGFAGSPIIQIDGSQIFKPGSTPPVQLADVNGLAVTARSTVRGLVINRFTGNGILLLGSSGSTIAGNYLGVGLDGQTPLGNSYAGISIVDSRSNEIGGIVASDRNVVSGNGGPGVAITTSKGQSSNGGNIVEGNYIGTDAAGVDDLGNQNDGVLVVTNGNRVGGVQAGAANLIAFNGGAGVGVFGYSYAQLLNTAILSNSIHDNAQGGIDLGYNANDPVSSASLNSAYVTAGGTVVEGWFYAAPSTTYRVQFFANPTEAQPYREQGRTFLETVKVATDDFGRAEFTITLASPAPAGQYLSATVTDPNLTTTSEFFGSTLVTTTARADLAVAMGADDFGVYAGSPLTYTIDLANNGPSNATNVVLTDLLPGGVTVKSVSAPQGKVVQADGSISVKYDKITNGDSRTVQITVIPGAVGTLTNTASATADQTDLNPDDDTASVVTTVLANPNPPAVVDQKLVVAQDSITGLVLSFNQPLDPTQAVNPINYGLRTGDEPGLFNVVVPLGPPAYDAVNSILTLTPTQPLQLGKVYRLTINGQGAAGVTDFAGDLLTGNTALGSQGPYVWQFSRGAVPAPPLAVAAQNLIVTRNAITAAVLTFNRPLDPDQAVNPINYALAMAGPNGVFNHKVAIQPPVYDPGSQTVRLTPTRPLRLGVRYQLTVDGQGSAGVVDQSGGLLAGNTDLGAQGPWNWQFSRGYVPHPATARRPPRFQPAPRVRLVESSVNRRVLSGPASRSANGTISNALPPLAETSDASNSIDTRPS